MRISASKWKRYTGALARINQEASQKMIDYAKKNGLEDGEALVRYAKALTDTYCEGSSSLACEMYDEIARLQGAVVSPAEPADLPEYGEVAKSVYGTLKQSPDGKLIGDSVGRLVKRSSSDTMLKNAKRDHAEFAWIPSGDACAFCEAIASRGWQRASKNTVRGDHADHIHANCQCEFAIRFSSDMDVVGYDPDKLLEKYESAEGDTPNEKINSMRREHAHQRTGNDMTAEEFANYKRELDYARKLPEIRLQKKEYALVVHELNNNMTKEDRKHAIVTKPVGNYIYTIVNRGFDEYTFVGKELIR